MVDANEVLSKIDIVDVVSEYVDLERKGKNYFGLCPFHDDSNPSMSVSTDKQLFKCFSCGAGGDAIKFIKDIENISFKEALVKLGKTVGIEIESHDTYSKINDDYYNIYLDVTKYFSYMLFHNKFGSEYLKYLENRKFDFQTLEHFKIGVSNNDIVELLNKKYSKNEVLKTNLVNSANNLVFRNRIIFPITDINGNVVGYSGRVINDATPKYLNSSENKYFKKSNILYNYFESKQAVAKSKSVIITEGFFDVMRLHSIGIENVIATMGTAFSTHHAKLISDVCKTVYLSMDSDEAGIKACKTIYNLLVKYEMKIFMVDLKGLDPDEFVLKYGREKYVDCINSAKIYEEFYIDSVLDNYFDLSVAKQEEALVDVTMFINSIANENIKQVLSNYVTTRIGITLYGVNINRQKQNVQVNNFDNNQRNNNVRRKQDSVVESYYAASLNEDFAINKFEVEYISLMLRSSYAIERYNNDIKAFNIMRNDEVAMLVKEFYIQNKEEDIYKYISDKSLDYSKEQLEILLNIVEVATNYEIIVGEEIVDDYVNKIRGYRYDKNIEAIKNKLEETLDPNDKIKLLEQLNVLINKKNNNTESRRS